MKITTCYEPRVHIVIEDFLEPEQLTQVMEEIESLQEFFETGLYEIDGNQQYVPDLKMNNILWLDQHYGNNRQSSKILTILPQQLWQSELMEYMSNHKEPLFELWGESNSDKTQISAYGNSDFYEWHKDGIRELVYLTFVLMLNKEPKKFEGGDFVLKFNDYEKVVPFKNNRAIIFPSRTLHKVTPIKVKGNEFMDKRFTIQNWASKC